MKARPVDVVLDGNADLILDQLDRIRQSDFFSRADRQLELLDYVVRRSLEEDDGNLLGKNIAHAVFSSSEASPAHDVSTVRVEIGRLRRSLHQYYSGEGQADPIVIDIPKGAYRATFEARNSGENVGADASSVPADDSGGARRVSRLQATIFAAVVLILIAGFVVYRGATRIALEPAQTDVPVIAVLPFSTLAGGDPGRDPLIDGLAEDIITDLSKVGSLRVISYGSTERLEHIDDIVVLEPELGATHALRGAVQRVGTGYRINLSLADVGTRQQQWSERFEFPAGDLSEIQLQIARDVSRALSVVLDPHDLAAIERGAWKSAEAAALFDQAMSVMNPPNDPGRLAAAETLVDRIISNEPKSSMGYSAKALIIAYKASFVHADPAVTHEEVEALAARALEINPSDAVAHFALSVSSQTVGDIASAVRHAKMAVEIEPSNSRALAQLGLALSFSGEPRRGIEALEAALRFDPNSPRQPYLNQLALAHYLAEDFETTLDLLDRNLERGGPYGPHLMAVRAAALSALGRDEERQSVLKEMAQLENTGPGLDYIASWLRRFTPDEELIAPVLHELDQATLLD